MSTSTNPATPFVAHPGLDPRWGTFAEELLHHTSRYYRYAEVALRHLGGMPGFTMAGYRSERLDSDQRDLMTAIMFRPPGRHTAVDLMRIVSDVIAGRDRIPVDLLARYRIELDRLHHPAHPTPGPDASVHWPDAHAHLVDPFLALARRLQFPVAIQGRTVAVCLQVLAQHLDSPVPQIRNNLRDAVFWLHEGGYRLKNHPGLTHRDAARLDTSGNRSSNR